MNLKNLSFLENALSDLFSESSTGETIEQTAQCTNTDTDSATHALKQSDADSSTEPEPLLVAQAKEDPQQFGTLYERYVDRIFAYIYRRVGNTQDSEDLTAHTFFKAFDKLHSYEDRGFPFSAWLFTIARNLVANWHRDHGRRRFLSLDRLWSHSSDSETPEQHLERAERDSALWSAIERLPMDRRAVVLYKFGYRLSNVEIGKLMDRSESAIKSLYFRTLSALRKDLEATNGQESR